MILLHLTQMRHARRLSQRTLSVKTGISQNMISRYESGMSDPSLTMLEKLMRALQCELADLVTINGTNVHNGKK